MTDEQILNRIRSESEREQGYRQLMNSYQESLYQHIRRLVRSHEDAADVLQNTFIRVFRHIDQFEGRSSLHTWLFRIATNESLSFLKKQSRRKLVFEGNHSQNGMENRLLAETGPEGDKIRIWLKQAMDVLPEKQKVVFSLRYFGEMSYEELSEATGTSAGALKASFHHAVRKIEKHLKQRMEHFI